MTDATEPTGKRGFLEELKRRHVARMARSCKIPAGAAVAATAPLNLSGLPALLQELL